MTLCVELEGCDVVSHYAPRSVAVEGQCRLDPTRWRPARAGVREQVIGAVLLVEFHDRGSSRERTAVGVGERHPVAPGPAESEGALGRRQPGAVALRHRERDPTGYLEIGPRQPLIPRCQRDGSTDRTVANVLGVGVRTAEECSGEELGSSQAQRPGRSDDGVAVADVGTIVALHIGAPRNGVARTAATSAAAGFAREEFSAAATAATAVEATATATATTRWAIALYRALAAGARCTGAAGSASRSAAGPARARASAGHPTCAATTRVRAATGATGAPARSTTAAAGATKIGILSGATLGLVKAVGTSGAPAARGHEQGAPRAHIGDRRRTATPSAADATEVAVTAVGSAAVPAARAEARGRVGSGPAHRELEGLALSHIDRGHLRGAQSAQRVSTDEVRAAGRTDGEDLYGLVARSRSPGLGRPCVVKDDRERSRGCCRQRAGHDGSEERD